ncbi:MAG: aminotransferase class V-fold PLP-dependent enzyme [Candidatus Rokubacteria bacterium]|nr:aminotransferase class V-fold PLP-dependent enzyme [Candidatus Rokubacteria bacterium]
MKAVILAAGAGRSLYPLTKDRPKALLDVRGVTLLDRLLAQTAGRGLTPVVVVGWEQAKVVDALRHWQRTVPTRAEVVVNPIYERTNTLYSLWLAAAACRNEALLVVDGDLVCEDAVMAAVIEDPRPTLVAIDRARVMGEEEVKVVVAPDARLLDIGKVLAPDRAHGEFLGLAKYSPEAAARLFAILDELVRAGAESAYYEDALARLAGETEIATLDVAGRRWVEIDFFSDYLEALRLFGDGARADALAALPAIRRQLLFCPGPVQVSRRVKAALAAPEIGHREVEFSELLNRTRLKLSRVFGVRNFHHYATVIVNGSGTAANEALLVTAGVGRRLLVLSNGEFGERLVELARHLDLSVEALRHRWGQPFDLAALERRLAAGGVDAVAWVHHETSTGMLNPVAPVAALAARFGADTFLDAVSSVGGLPIDVEAHGLTFCTGSANKAIGSVPGLSFVCGRRSAFEALAAVRARSVYLDLYKHFHYNDRLYQTPNTPAVNLYFALEASLDELLAEGLAQRAARYRRLAHRLRRGFRRLGLRPFLPEEQMSPLLTTVELPVGFSAVEFHDALKEAGYIVYAGKGILRDRVFQVANIGALTPRHVDAFLSALGRILEKDGVAARRHPGRRLRLAPAPAD